MRTRLKIGAMALLLRYNGIPSRVAVGFATGEVEGNGVTVEICFQVDFRREPASRAAQRLTFLPPFAPAAETWARTTVLSNICTR